MPIIRNPFRKQDENVRPTANNSLEKPNANGNGIDKTVEPIAIKEPAEYKLSGMFIWMFGDGDPLRRQWLMISPEINDSGVYLPPSPPERKGFWHTKSSNSVTSSNHRSVISENEPFNISRESFDSYRRSFVGVANSDTTSA